MRNEAAGTIDPVATVLVVDDEPIVREVVVRYLEREGYATLEADDGDHARALVERESPDLVLPTHELSVDACVDALLALLRDRGALG